MQINSSIFILQRNAAFALFTEKPAASNEARARMLDQAADDELVLGHVAVAERLSHMAAELRVVRR